jgi:hypothetical protein
MDSVIVLGEGLPAAFNVEEVTVEEGKNSIHTSRLPSGMMTKLLDTAGLFALEDPDASSPPEAVPAETV